MSGKVSETRLRVLEFLVSYMESHRYAPTRTEIADAVSLNSRSSIQYHIDSLVEDGYLERITYKHRKIRPTESGVNAIKRLRIINAGGS